MSRQEMPDDQEFGFPLLRQLLGGYFHQDWPLDGGSWEEVTDDFIAESTGPSVAATADELRSLLAGQLSDQQLEDTVDELGGSVDPSAFDLSAREWLEAVAARLARPR